MSCAMCTRSCGTSNKCSRCKAVYYCDRECQKRHWSVHKFSCCAVVKKTKAASASAAAPAAARRAVPAPVPRMIEPEVILQPPSVVFLGLGRDCGRYVERCLLNFERLAEKIFKGAAEAGFLFYENDSSDGTLELLEDFAARNPRRREVVSEKDVDARFPDRTHRIAYGRNRLLERLAEKRWLAECSYVVVCDLDDVNAKIDLSGAASALWHMDRGAASVVTANQPDNYYDLWALRTEAFDVNSWLLDHRRTVCDLGLGAFFPDVPRKAVAGLLEDGEGGPSDAGTTKHLTTFHAGYDVPRNQVIRDEVPVLSAFGGLAFYAAKVLRRADDPTTLAPAKYDGADPNMTPPACHPLFTNQDCEHVAFHKALRDYHGSNFHICIHPRLMNCLETRDTNPKAILDKARNLNLTN